MAENMPIFSENVALQMMCEGFYLALNNPKTLFLAFAEQKKNGTSELYILGDNRFLRFPPFGFAQDIFIALRILAKKSGEKELVGLFIEEERTAVTLEGEVRERRWDIVLAKEQGITTTRKENFQKLWESSKDEIALAIHNARKRAH